MTQDIKVQDEDIQELLKQFPAIQKELTIIAQRRIIRELELANQQLIKQKANIKISSHGGRVKCEGAVRGGARQCCGAPRHIVGLGA